MPNWCSNHLEIKSSKTALKQLLEKARAPASPHDSKVAGFSFLPFVEHLLPKTYEQSWYDDNIELLGCKWFPAIDEHQLQIDDNSLTLSFMTPWSPSDNATRHMARWLDGKHFDYSITHAFDEAGYCYCGLLTIDSSTGESEQQGEFSSLCSEDILAMDKEEIEQVGKSCNLSARELLERAEQDGFIDICSEFYQPYI